MSRRSRRAGRRAAGVSVQRAAECNAKARALSARMAATTRRMTVSLCVAAHSYTDVVRQPEPLRAGGRPSELFVRAALGLRRQLCSRPRLTAARRVSASCKATLAVTQIVTVARSSAGLCETPDGSTQALQQSVLCEQLRPCGDTRVERSGRAGPGITRGDSSRLVIVLTGAGPILGTSTRSRR